MLLYYPFWMFMGFTIHFYIIFGTNLLPEAQPKLLFFSISVFLRKGISSGVQMEWNLQESCFWNKRNPGDLEWTSRSSWGGHKGARRAPGGAPPASCAPCGSPDRPPLPIYICVPWKHPGAPWNPISIAATFCTREIPSWGLFRRSVGGGICHGGLLHQHHSLSDELWVVYHRPSGP